MPAKQIAIIGAGLAGAVLSHRLTAAGHQVTVFDKSRGSGGRHASFRYQHSCCNLGAPWFEPSTEAFRNWLIQQPDIKRCQPAAHSFDNQPVVLEVFKVRQKQSNLTRRLLQNSLFRPQHRITEILPHRNGLTLQDEKQQHLGDFNQVILTTPAMQSIPLLTTEPALATRLTHVCPLPAWVSILELEHFHHPETEVFIGAHPQLKRAIRYDIRKQDTRSKNTFLWQVEANSDWSYQHQDSDKDQVTGLLIEQLASLPEFEGRCQNLRTHRWLYARHSQPLEESYYFNEDTGIGMCGDSFGEGSEGAWHSAMALAERLSKV